MNTPRRDPVTGAFTQRAKLTAKTLRKAWAASARSTPPLSKAEAHEVLRATGALRPAPNAALRPSVNAAALMPILRHRSRNSRVVAFATASLRHARVDLQDAVIRGVSVITSGVTARGHDLDVDAKTLQQMKACAEAKGVVPVKVDHKSGAAAVCGYLTNFQIVGRKLVADWHLLKTHPQTAQILEVAEVMPSGIGLSASFLPPEDSEQGKARCEELISVDLVTLPAANPDGLFAANIGPQPNPNRQARQSATDKVERVIGGGIGAAAGAIAGADLVHSGVSYMPLLGLRRFRPSPGLRKGLLGAAAIAGGAIGIRAALAPKKPDDQQQNNFAADLALVRQALREFAADARRDADNDHRSLGKRILIRAAKVGVGAGLGALAGRTLGSATGAVGGAGIGALAGRKLGKGGIVGGAIGGGALGTVVGRKIGTGAGVFGGAAAGLLFQSKAAQDATRHALALSKKFPRKTLST